MLSFNYMKLIYYFCFYCNLIKLIYYFINMKLMHYCYLYKININYYSNKIVKQLMQVSK